MRQKIRNLKVTFTVVVLAMATLLNTSNLQAAEISGVYFNPKFQDEGIEMNLQGMGLKSMVFFKAFVAGYYSEEGSIANPLDNVPKRIEVEYFVNIPAKKLNAYTVERMLKNVSKSEFRAIQEEVELMSQYFVDLNAGDRFSLTFIPDIGTKFAHNGVVTGVIEGEEFSKALFSVWIGDKPFDQKLKRQILGLEKNSLVNEEIALRVSEGGA